MTDERDMEPLHGPDFVLDVENFGPIAEARDIAFKPMTVFVGPSNTGKSYLALLLHALLKGLDERTRFRLNPPGQWSLASRAEKLANLWRETFQLTRRLSENGEFATSNEVAISSFALETRSILKDSIDYQLDAWSDGVQSSLCEYFEAVEVDELANVGNPNRTSTSFALRASSEIGNWTFTYDSGRPDFEIAASRLSWQVEDLTRVMERIEKDELDDPGHRVSGLVLLNYMTTIVRRIDPKYRSWYLLASRTGILASHRVLTDSIVSRAHRYALGEERRGEPSFHKVAADFLRAINAIESDLGSFRRRTHRRDSGLPSRIADLIERKVLLGSVEVELNRFGPPEFKFAPDTYPDLKVPMMRTSSMATELAPVVAFLRSHIEEGDLLIIEEPEAHLHPAAQQRLAGVLAYMVRKGLRVLITTHSHYMVEAMGMFLNSSRVDTDKRADSMRLLGNEVDRELYLNEDEVAVYSFDSPNEIGTVVKQVPFDEGSLSFAPESYSDALVDQFNRISRVVGARIDADELAEAS